MYGFERSRALLLVGWRYGAYRETVGDRFPVALLYEVVSRDRQELFGKLRGAGIEMGIEVPPELRHLIDRGGISRAHSQSLPA